MSGFKYFAGDTDIAMKLPLAASQTVLKGDLFEFTNGVLTACNGQTDVPKFWAKEDKTSGAAENPLIKVGRIIPYVTILEIAFTPIIDDVAARTNSTDTTVEATMAGGGSNDDVNGGLVYCKELDEFRVIADSSYSSTALTLTVTEAFSRAITVGDTVRLVAFGFSTAALKLASSNPQRGISNAVADVASGKLIVRNVDMAKKKAYVSFLPS